MNRRKVWLLTTPGAVQEGGCCCFSWCCYSCCSSTEYTANILTPSVTQVSLPLQNVHTHVYTHIAPTVWLFSFPSSNPLVLPPLPFLFMQLKLVFLVPPRIAIALAEGRFLAWGIASLREAALLVADELATTTGLLAGLRASIPAVPASRTRVPIPLQRGDENSSGEGGYWAVQLTGLCPVNLWNMAVSNEQWPKKY